MMPFPDVPIVTGTVLECRRAGCIRPAKSHDGLCRTHSLHRVRYVVLQVGGMVAISSAAFTHSLGLAVSGAFALLTGLSLER